MNAASEFFLGGLIVFSGLAHGAPCQVQASASLEEGAGVVLAGTGAWVEVSEVPNAARWKRILERDVRIEFTRRSAERARRALVAKDQGNRAESEALHLAAWMTLGSAGSVQDREFLARLLERGAIPQRCIAALSLGELGGLGVEQALLEALGDEDRRLRSCALLGLLRAFPSVGRREAERFLKSEDEELQQLAAALLVFRESPSTSEPTFPATILLNLRWEAAVRFGLIDHSPYETLVLEEWLRNEEFVCDVIVRAAAELRAPGIRDHLLAIVMGSPSHQQLRACVRAMPNEISLLVRNDLWQPANAGEWSVVLDEIRAERLEALTGYLLRRALAEPEFELSAAGLLARAGDSSAMLDIDFEQPRDLLETVVLCRSLGDSRDLRWVDALQDFRRDKSPWIRAAALVAQARLGDQTALDELIGSFALVESSAYREGEADHDERLEMLLRDGADGATFSRLDEVLPHVGRKDAIRIASLLALRGRLSARASLRDLLEEGVLEQDLDVVSIRAMMLYPDTEDLRRLEAVFPLTTDHREAHTLNAELALGLMNAGSVESIPLLRRALWDGDWNTSILAGALWIQVKGLGHLIQEARGPARARADEKLRRVGFAIGKWGGSEALQLLRREVPVDTGNPILQGAYLGALSSRTH